MVLQCRILVDCVVFLGGGMVSGIQREDTVVQGVGVVFTSLNTCRVFKQSKIYVFMFCLVCFGGDESSKPL